MRVPSTGSFRTVAALAMFALTGCQTSLSPVVPDGEAGYAAISVQTEFAPPARYALVPGDVISMMVYEEPDLTVNEISVDSAGNVSLPLIGEIRAAGLSASELARSAEVAFATSYLRDPRVSILVKKARQATIAVEGEVETPGVFPYAEGQTLLSALALARSPTETAKLDEVMVFRTVNSQKMAGRFDVREIRAGRSPDVAMMPGDVVVVGYSTMRGAYLDALRALPILGIFRPI